MPTDSIITEYIDSKAAFAQEIMQHLRTIIHQASPALTESIKWRAPCFESNGLVCAMAGFKKHVNLSFFKGKLIDDKHHIFPCSDNNELASLTFSSLDEVPDASILIDYIQQAIALNQVPNTKKKSKIKKQKADLIIPDDLREALGKSPIAQEVFSEFSYTKQKDYIEWLTSAKRESTRRSRLVTAIEWITEGKSRNWKYENC